MNPIARLTVTTPDGTSGELSRQDQGAYLFRYGIGVEASSQISLTMGVRDTGFLSQGLHPIFQMNLPEGYVLEQLRDRLAKVATLDPMLLIALTGSGSPVGRVMVRSDIVDAWVGRSGSLQGENLQKLLAWDGAQDLFTRLVDKYIFRAGISGVQPKVLVPEFQETDPKATLLTPELIVKSGRSEFPGLAANEFLCMDAARRAGIAVPEFFLSENRQLFIMRRFDRTARQQALGFEDMAVLTGRGTEQKYQGSYSQIAKAIRLFCGPAHISASLSQLFDMVALSCIVGNGDAHLKNFGLLYSDSSGSDARLAPAYDIVNTTAYLRDDALALSLAGSKSLFHSRLGILEFAQDCDIGNPRERVRELIDATYDALKANHHLRDEIAPVFTAIEYCAGQFHESFR